MADDKDGPTANGAKVSTDSKHVQLNGVKDGRADSRKVKREASKVKQEPDDTDDDDSSSASGQAGNSRSSTPVNRQTRNSRSLSMRNRIHFKYSSHIKEDHNSAVFGAVFNHHLNPSLPPVFAAVGHNRVTVYKCPPDGTLLPQFVFADPDKEEFFAGAWSYVPLTYVPVLAVGGKKGIVRVIYCYGDRPMPAKTFTGHGSSVNDLKFCPRNPNLLLSASKDHAIRLWNCETEVLVAIFGGVDGHRDEVLGIDVHVLGHAFVSCGMDHALKIWKLDGASVIEAVQASRKVETPKQRTVFPTAAIHFPSFSTRDVHHNYVDCVAWHGDSIISKSCEHDLKFWRPEPAPIGEKEALIMHEVSVKKKKSSKDVNIWYLKFGFDCMHRMLAVGDACRTYIYDLDVDDPTTINAPAAVLSHPKCVSVVRVAAFSFEGDILISTCDDGSIFRWDRVKPGQN